MTVAQSLATSRPIAVGGERLTARGKFIFQGDEKLYVRGVTYGAFRPDADGNEYWDLTTIESDFAQMAASGLNAVRIPHTMPPRTLLDAAARHGLRVMVGLSAEQFTGYLIDRTGAPDIAELVRKRAMTCAGHPSLLCYAIGNEIPAPMVRWLGARRVERYLERIYRIVKAVDPAALVTYVNYPSTEYLDLSFLDLVCFNVYLESQERLEAYLYRLHNLAGERPLLMSELGLDSLRHGEETQARVLDWQIQTVGRAGCAGAFVFTWTDEWHRAGAEVEDWAFGLTRRDRTPKPAMETVSRAFAEGPIARDLPWPRISVVVCSHNGGRTIRDCLEGLRRLDYPDFEVIVVDDGSTDATATIAQEYDVRVIQTENRGLSSARNTGLEAATGEIVAYTDDDARPDPQWLTYLALEFMDGPHVGVGGPNIAPPGDGWIAECIAHAPGGPMHVLLSDRVAEHIPGCNMAFRKAALEAIGGFDPRFQVAGDDVDACWRLQQRGWTIGFSPAAWVWHHRRNSVRTYWKQQQGYGKAEALLERKWPEKYNAMGHVTWAGRIYGRGLTQALALRRGRIYHGLWGSAPFQSLDRPSPGVLLSLPLMPEWFLVIAVLGALALLGAWWRPLLIALPLFALAVLAVLIQAGTSAARARFASEPGSPRPRFRMVLLTALLHVIQPVARLRGRFRWGLTPWRRRGAWGWVSPLPRHFAHWTERWEAPADRLSALETSLGEGGAIVRRGADFERWDLEVRGGAFGAVRILMAVEDQGAGNQYVRTRLWPRVFGAGLVLMAALGLLAFLAARDHARGVAAVLGMALAVVIVTAVFDCGAAAAAILAALRRHHRDRT